jgi:hypothetical protein
MNEIEKRIEELSKPCSIHSGYGECAGIDHYMRTQDVRQLIKEVCEMQRKQDLKYAKSKFELYKILLGSDVVINLLCKELEDSPLVTNKQ